MLITIIKPLPVRHDLSADVKSLFISINMFYIWHLFYMQFETNAVFYYLKGHTQKVTTERNILAFCFVLYCTNIIA